MVSPQFTAVLPFLYDEADFLRQHPAYQVKHLPTQAKRVTALPTFLGRGERGHMGAILKGLRLGYFLAWIEGDSHLLIFQCCNDLHRS